jgi:prolyl oligopeptidase
MKAALLAFAVLTGLSAQTVSKLNYPPAPKGNQADDYHGTKIADPYRGLEDADSAATQQWVAQENALTFSYLEKLPGRAAIKSRLTELWNYEKFTPMEKAGNHYFYFRNSGLQNQSVLYVKDGLAGTPRVLLDPNTYRADGTAALRGESPSWKGNLYAYAVAQAGSDWGDWHVRDVITGKDLPDVVRWTKTGSVAWTADDRGFYYSRYPEPPAGQLLTAQALHSKVYLHRLGEAQSADKLIYERPDQPQWFLNPSLTEDGRYLFIAAEGVDTGKNLLFVEDLQAAKPHVTELISKFEAIYDPVGSVGSLIYLRTTDGAARGRVMTIDLAHPSRADWKPIVAEKAEPLEAVQLADNKLLLTYMKDAHSTAELTGLDGKLLETVEMPGTGTAMWSPARQGDKEVFYGYTDFTTPAWDYRLDLETGKSSVIQKPELKFDPAAFETKQVFYASKDGTRVPMFLTYRKGLKQDGMNPTLLYGYGGFDISITPTFRTPFLEWMEMGGVIAVANLRGGSEYGEAWHQAGVKSHKQNVFDDFIAAAEWLIANKYTSTPKLAINGASNGGLLIGAVLNQRPDLFGAAMPDVGVMDMLRFHKFGFGPSWTGDFGSPDDPEDFKAIRAYSPLHNIRKGAQYPATLITTSDHDDRVMPGHSLKYAATLQDAQEGPAPILIRIEARAGHGAGKPTSKQIDEWADRLTFLKSALGMN